jgi:hypothetical protein
MKHLSRREALRGTGVAALAAAGVAPLPFVTNASDDPLLSLLNRCLAEWEYMDGIHGDLDGRRAELGWDEVERRLDEESEAHRNRSEAMLKAMIRLPAQAASSIVIIDLVCREMEIGTSIFEDYYLQLLQSVSTYIAATGVRS